MSDKIKPPAVKFPPPILYLVLVLLAFGADRLLHLPRLTDFFQIRMIGGILLFGLGILINIAAVWEFRKNKENPIPWTGSDVFIAEGLYRFTRNPMYLGMSALSFGIAVGWGSYAMFAAAILATLIINYAVIQKEEAYLETRFGESYAQYKAKVRRWI